MATESIGSEIARRAANATTHAGGDGGAASSLPRADVWIATRAVGHDVQLPEYDPGTPDASVAEPTSPPRAKRSTARPRASALSALGASLRVLSV